MSRIFYLLVLVVTISGCSRDTFVCDENHALVSEMRLVSDERWNEFMNQISFIWPLESHIRYNDSDKTPEIPSELSDLKIISIAKSGKDIGLFGLARCFDHGIHLRVTKGSKKIEIVWGEIATYGTEVLWKND